MTTLASLLHENFPELTEPELIQQMIKYGKLYHAEAGDKIMEVGRYIKTMPLLVKGSVKVLRQDEEGREVFLYYLQPGETCAMSLICCMANVKSEIEAMAEENMVRTW